MIGRRIREARLRAGFSQVEASVELGRGPTVLSRWERDVREPRVRDLIAMARLYGVSVEWLATGHESAA